MICYEFSILFFHNKKAEYMTIASIPSLNPWKMVYPEAQKFMCYHRYTVLDYEAIPIEIRAVIGHLNSVNLSIIDMLHMRIFRVSREILSKLPTISGDDQGLKYFVSNIPAAMTYLKGAWNSCSPCDNVPGANCYYLLVNDSVSVMQRNIIKYNSFLEQSVDIKIRKIKEFVLGKLEEMGLLLEHFRIQNPESCSIQGHDYLTSLSHIRRPQVHPDTVLSSLQNARYALNDLREYIKVLSPYINLLEESKEKLSNLDNLITRAIKNDGSRVYLKTLCATALNDQTWEFIREINVNERIYFNKSLLCSNDVSYYGIACLNSDNCLFSSNWYRKHYNELIRCHDIFTSTVYHTYELSLYNENLIFNDEKNDLLHQSCTALFDMLQPLQEDVDLFNEYSIQTSVGSISFNQAMKGAKFEIELVADIEPRCIGAFERAMTILDDYRTRMTRRIIHFLEKKAQNIRYLSLGIKKKIRPLDRSTTDHATKEDIKEEINKIMILLDKIQNFIGLIDDHFPEILKLIDELFYFTPLEITPKAKEISKPKKKKKRGSKSQGTSQIKKVLSPSLVEIPEKHSEEEIPEPESKLEIEQEGSLEVVAEEVADIAERLCEVMEASFIEQKNTTEYRSPFNVTWRELFRELREAGFKLIQKTGSHAQFKHIIHPKAGRISVPVHGKIDTVSVGVVKSIRETIDNVGEFEERETKTSDVQQPKKSKGKHRKKR